MGIFDAFRKNKDEVHGPRVLVCAIDGRFHDVLKTDSDVYRRFYPATSLEVLPSIQALLERLEGKYDIVHLFVDVTETGTLRDSRGHEITGTELIRRCCDQDVKLLWSASENPPDRYIKGFAARGKRLNLVMTLQRKGPSTLAFLRTSCREWPLAKLCQSLGVLFAHRFRDQIATMRQSRFSLLGVAGLDCWRNIASRK
jgi:hypothetical protein